MLRFFMRRRHATEHVDDPELTLCGKRIDGKIHSRQREKTSHDERVPVTVDNVNMTCRSCIKVIRSRCRAHNKRRCGACGSEGKITYVGE